MAFDFPSSPTVGQQFIPVAGTTYVYNGYGWTLLGSGGSGPASSFGGRLTFVSATALKFAPFNGNQIKINGAVLTIPNAGIAGVANTSVFVNGTTGQNLAANTTYWVFAFSNSGTVTADFRTSATHATSATAGNEGVEILTGDDTRSLIGICRTNASSQFADSTTQRFVRSWFNCLKVDLVSTALADETSTSTTYIEIAFTKRVEFVKWAGEIVSLNFTGTMTNSAASNRVVAAIGIDSIAPVSPECCVHTGGAAFNEPIACHYASTALAEGYHDGRMLGGVGSAVGQWSVTTNMLSGGIASRLSGFVGGI